jgi:hypothetical protein
MDSLTEIQEYIKQIKDFKVSLDGALNNLENTLKIDPTKQLLKEQADVLVKTIDKFVSVWK